MSNTSQKKKSELFGTSLLMMRARTSSDHRLKRDVSESHNGWVRSLVSWLLAPALLILRSIHNTRGEFDGPRHNERKGSAAGHTAPEFQLARHGSGSG